MRRSLALIALSLFFCGPLLAAQGRSLSPDRYLLLGPLPVPPAVFGKAPDKSGLNPKGLEPKEGAKVSWLGTNYAWSLWEPGKGGAFPKVEKGSLVYLAVYTENPKWQSLSFQVTGSGDGTLYLDGAKLGSIKNGKGDFKRRCPKGHWPVVMKLSPPKTGSWTPALMVTASGVKRPEAPSFQVDPKYIPARFDRIWSRKGVRNLSMSPSGGLLALTMGEEIQIRSGAQVVHRSRIGRASWLTFQGEERILFLEKGDLKSLDWKSGRQKTLLKALPSPGNLRLSPDGASVYWLESPAKPKRPSVDHRTTLRQSMRDWNPGCRIWRADLGDGLRRPITAKGDFQIASFELNPKGTSLVLVRKSPVPKRPWFTTQFWAVDTKSLESRKIGEMQTGFESWPGDLRFSPDGERFLFVGPPEEIWHPLDKRASKMEKGQDLPEELRESHGEHNYHNADLFVVELKTGVRRSISAGFDPGIATRVGARPWWSPDGKTIHFLAYTGRRNTFYSVEWSIEKPLFKVWEAGPLVVRNYAVALEASPPKVAFSSGSFTRLSFVATLGLEDRAPKEIFDPNKELMEKWILSKPTDAAFLNKSGVKIDGWLYKPKVEKGVPLPLVVYYYAGATATQESMYWTHQFLVSNGYAVYVLNPRGAGEYGRNFADSHVNDWGQRASSDVMEGVDQILKANPEIDAKRVGCWGGSYGGFTTMDLVTKSKQFAAAVSLYGISNISSYWGGGTWGWTYGDMAAARSFPWNRPEIFIGRSPLFNADKINTPLLLLHGLADDNVPSIESDQMFTALKVLGRTVEYVAFAGENHGISGSRKNRSSHRTMMLEWFDFYLKGQPEAWKARWKK